MEHLDGVVDCDCDRSFGPTSWTLQHEAEVIGEGRAVLGEGGDTGVAVAGEGAQLGQQFE